MACTAFFSMGHPLGGPTETICNGSMGTLSIAHGTVFTDCRSKQVRGRINGGAWVSAPVFPFEFEGTYMADWTLRDIPGATCDDMNDNLDLQVQVDDNGTDKWLDGAPVTINAYCFEFPVPVRLKTTRVFKLEFSKLLPPTTLWAVIASKLADAKAVKLRRVVTSNQYPTIPLTWKSIGPAEGLWTLVAGADGHARLTLKVKGKVGSSTFLFQFVWACGNFSPIKGGLFGPIGDNPITQVLSIGRVGIQTESMKVNARGKAKTKAPAKAKPKAKKRLARR